MDINLIYKKKMEAFHLFASKFSHDLNSILTTIIYSAQLAIDDIDKTSQTHSDIQRIIDAGIEGSNYIRNVLSFVKPDNSDFKTMNLIAVTDDVIKNVKPIINNNIDFSVFHYKDSLPVFMDPEQLSFVISELLDNALLKLSQGGEITIETEISDSEPNAMLHITDNGPEIPDTIIEKIFDPFFTTNPPKLGIGLTTVYGIVASHKGSIQVKSEKGDTCFTLTFPISHKPLV